MACKQILGGPCSLMENDVYLKDLKEPAHNYALFADLNAGQTFHISHSDKTSPYNHYLCHCCWHTSQSDSILLLTADFFSLSFSSASSE